MAKRKNVTEDIKPTWFNPVRAAQAACKNNRGYAIVQMTILVNKNDPMLWAEPVLVKIHPAKLSDYELSPVLLAAMLEIVDSEVDNNKSGA